MPIGRRGRDVRIPHWRVEFFKGNMIPIVKFILLIARRLWVGLRETGRGPFGSGDFKQVNMVFLLYEVENALDFKGSEAVFLICFMERRIERGRCMKRVLHPIWGSASCKYFVLVEIRVHDATYIRLSLNEFWFTLKESGNFVHTEPKR